MHVPAKGSTLGLSMLVLGTSAVLGAGVVGASPNEASAIGALSGGLASAKAPDGSYLLEPSVGVSLLTEFVDTSLHVDFGKAEVAGGVRNAMSFAPAIGAHIEKNSDQEGIVQLFGLVRLPIQRRTGAGLADSTGVALGAEAGARFIACKPDGTDSSTAVFQGVCIGLSVSLRYQQHLSDFQMGSAVLPSGSATLSMPFMLFVGFNPRAL